ncbi:hypothetical protein GCM10007301_15440 [Azorhizobium oxalatiphilum]|uniref:Bacteriophage lambda head decoration protein D n=1 Tax=Azorhizobium oxalatiphilum TaxID=980631 RepID=A0A917F8J2_9HYPH|nr:head decoration protein [Azorhizobium oxalatiphilum]GGF56662.1 hypothetical protein GCM10007301_15440 [Azorhizobium oxalatiphilum]
MAQTLTQDLAVRTANYIISEANGYLSRDQVLVASGAGVVKPATVLAKVTASGKFVPLAPAATDGSQNAAAILYEGCDATSVDVRRTVSSRATEVQAAVLIWPAGITAPQKTAALAQLAALQIIAR